MDEVENPDVSAQGQIIHLQEAEGPDGDQDYDIPRNEQETFFGPVDTGPSVTTEAEAVPEHPGPSVTVAFKPPLPKDRVALPTRPILKRELSAPAPPPPQQAGSEPPTDAPDSLTLADLRKIREGFPPTPVKSQELPPLDKFYKFTYEDAQSFPVEIEEWFTYDASETQRIRSLPRLFEAAWAEQHGPENASLTHPWIGTSKHDAFVVSLLEKLDRGDDQAYGALSPLCYLVLGVFKDTEGQTWSNPLGALFTDTTRTSLPEPYVATSGLQIKMMVEFAILLFRTNALEIMLKIVELITARDINATPQSADENIDSPIPRNENEMSDDLWTCFTILSVLFEVARLGGDTTQAQTIRHETNKHASSYLLFFTKLIGDIRWEAAAPIPLAKLFTLHWKSVLLTFGGISRVDVVKANFVDKCEEKDIRGHPVITASPLDYHLFRQEISSKYPAYQAPKAIFPFEPENNSLLPPLRERRESYGSRRQSVTSQMSMSRGSIMHQPVHIATPAPSPPPSPAGPGGKGGKKQNYQTNQLFPFMYPPLDVGSNEIGGKGSTELQDALVGRKWYGSDVPTSILEAAELFAKRMRATRAMKQLWQVRVDFMKHDRGWKDDAGPEPEYISLDGQDSAMNGQRPGPGGTGQPKGDAAPLGTSIDSQGSDEDAKEHIEPLDKVADFYRDSLPFLQSYVIVSLKAVLQHVNDLVTRTNGRTASVPPDTNGTQASTDKSSPMDEYTLDQVDLVRTQEIANKALTGSLLLLLKWFKVSHILRYEYLSQLLVDSNYIPLALKLWQTQEIGQVCHFKLDRPECNFFAMCTTQKSPRLPSQLSTTSLSSLDSSVPPSIQRHRRGSSSNSAPRPASAPASSTTAPDPFPSSLTIPEVDELGYPLTPIPLSPHTTFSWRNLFSSINHLRTLQKLTRRKAHRSLLLVSYKSTNHLRRTLRVPVAELRLYTLKLFKSQVPYCGRKWRHGNMKVITAVWLSVAAELRDDWLSGGGGGMGGAGPGDVDGTVEEALPLEQSLRALTHWWNCEVYPDEMGREREREGEEGFFERELERMGGLVGVAGAEVDEDEEEWDGGGEGAAFGE